MASRDILRTGVEWLKGFAFLVFLGILFGCLSTPFQNPLPSLQPNATPSCNTVVTQEPYQGQVCQNITKSDEVCAIRELNYSLGRVTKTELCTDNSLCVNRLPDGTCVTSYCSQGMTRCMANLSNLDAQKSGTWYVGANFSIDGTVFDKNPIKADLLPLETQVMDFDLSYSMDINQKKPVCAIFIGTPARIQDCSLVARTVVDCQNVTQYRNVSKEVCG